MKKFPSESVKLFYDDIDSLICLFTVDLYTYKRVLKFNTLDYPPGNVYQTPLVHKKVLGVVKDENKEINMVEFIRFKGKNVCLSI